MKANLDRRLSALETANDPGFKAWHRIIQNEGQSEDEAIAAYEAENGSIGDDDCILWVIIRKPSCAA